MTAIKAEAVGKELAEILGLPPMLKSVRLNFLAGEVVTADVTIFVQQEQAPRIMEVVALMTSCYSCHSDRAGPEPRGRPTEVLVQDGWRPLLHGEDVTREPIMKKVRTEWLPMKCGALEQAGYMDENCAGCANNQEAA